MPTYQYLCTECGHAFEQFQSFSDDSLTHCPECDGRLRKVTEPAPLVDLDTRYYKTISAFDARFPQGAPSLRQASSLTVEGDWTFEADVTVIGAARLADEGGPRTVPAGTRLQG